MQKLSISFLFLLVTCCLAVAQSNSRSGYPAPAEPQLRQFPCGGSAFFSEGFSSGVLPAGWQVRDRDDQNLAPQIDSLYQKGWHVIDDFKTEGNTSIASPSWYDNDSTPADDWLILPAVQVGNNTCFSWFAYSQDRFFAESYQVLISLDPPSGPDSILQQVDTLLEVDEEGFFINYRSVILSDIANGKYKNKQAYIAFRHTSLDKFMLVLDDLRLAEVEDEDLGVHPVENVSLSPGQSAFFTGGIRNYGSDTLTISGQEGLEVAFAVNGGEAVLDTLFTNDSLDFKIAPNDTLAFTLNKSWKSDSTAAIYYICLWTQWPDDENNANDTFCIRTGVGIDITSVDDPLQPDQLSLFPNPTSEQLYVKWQFESPTIHLAVHDAVGRQVLPTRFLLNQNQHTLDLTSLPRGMYFLRLRDANGRQIAQRFVKL